MTDYLTITPRDPLIARDGRPFGASSGNRMRSLDWLYPSVLAGSLRTLLGKRADKQFNTQDVEALKKLTIAGPLPTRDGQLFFPRPLDCVVREGKGLRECFGARPVQMDEGCDLPDGLQPLLLPEEAGDFKPAKIPAFWSRDKITQWLLNPSGAGFPPIPEKGSVGDGFLNAPEKDVRVHVKMDPGTGAGAKEDALFMTSGLDFSLKGNAETVELAARVAANGAFNLDKLDALHPLGGERRLARWKADGSGQLWACPDELTKALAGTRYVRMVLATPAIFSTGWKPGWLNSGPHELEGTAPSSQIRLRLVSALVERWKPLSGWSLEKPFGPKPIRRLVPAGSVYFFEVAHGNTQSLENCWLEPVSDGEQDRRDGFGLALWGVWNEPFTASKGA